MSILSTQHAIRSTPEVISLVKQAQRGSAQALEELVACHWRLITQQARRYEHVAGSLTHEDLLQCGAIGLLEAVRRFEPRRGLAFSTYAVPWIRQAIRRSINTGGYAIRLPDNLQDRLYRIRQAQDRLRQSRARADYEAAMDHLKLCEKKRETVRAVPSDPLSLNEPVGEDQETERGELIPDPAAVQAEQVIDAHAIRTALASLPPRYAHIIHLLYWDGLDAKETGRRMGISGQRVRQIRMQALSILRTSLS